MLVLAWIPRWTLFTIFVGGAMVWLAANALYWAGSEPRLNPGADPKHPAVGCCTACAISPVCIADHAKHA